MPELPEVETIRRGLIDKVLNKKIVRFVVKKRRLLKNKASQVIKLLQNNHFLGIERIGKLLIFRLHRGQYLLVHLKMTGQLIYRWGDKLIAGGHSTRKLDIMPGKYSYIIFDFADGSQLYFNDMRQFGYIHLVDHQEKEKIKNKFGLEPLTANFTLDAFRQRLKNRSGIIKAVLLNQQIFAGIGNIYADEICFRAGIRPDRKINTLSLAEVSNLYAACQYILAKAVKMRGTTFNNYRDSDNNKGNFVKYLKVYGRAGQKCLRCKKSLIKKTKVGGRGTCFCPNCQK